MRLFWWTIFVALLAIFIAVIMPPAPPDLEWNDTIVPMAQRYAAERRANDGGNDEEGDNNTRTTAKNKQQQQQPLKGTTIVITGATNGIGLALTRALSKLGATVVAIGRSKERLANLQSEVMPSIRTFQMDLSDLASVARTSNEILENVPHIDILINNAGMHAATSDVLGKHASVGENPAYDRVFVVNYLSHFLLTEKLAERLSQSKKPVIVQTSSSFHWAVDGSDLLIPQYHGEGEEEEGPKATTMPIAAQPGGSPGYFIFRTQRSYANSKLAQILHARALKHRHPELEAARIVSFCPGWVATNIAGRETFATAILDKAAFPMEGWGIASALHAILGSSNDGDGDGDGSSSSGDGRDDYYINSRIFNVVRWLVPQASAPWFYRYAVRDVILYVGAMTILWIQNLGAYAGPSRSSPESYNETIAMSLYDWSHSAVVQYL